MNSKGFFSLIQNGVVAGLPMLVLFLADCAPYWFGVDLYARYWWLDIVMHTLGGVVAAWSVHRLFSLYEKRAKLVIKPRWLFFLGLFLATAFIGIVWEWYEYLHDVFYPTMIFQPSIGDTMGDLFNDLVGACLFIVVLAVKKKKP